MDNAKKIKIELSFQGKGDSSSPFHLFSLPFFPFSLSLSSFVSSLSFCVVFTGTMHVIARVAKAREKCHCYVLQVAKVVDSMVLCGNNKSCSSMITINQSRSNNNCIEGDNGAGWWWDDNVPLPSISEVFQTSQFRKGLVHLGGLESLQEVWDRGIQFRPKSLFYFFCNLSKVKSSSRPIQTCHMFFNIIFFNMVDPKAQCDFQ